MIQSTNIGKTNDYVYDVSADGTIVNALGMNIISNTDGFNFKMPSKDNFRYTQEQPYISNGNGRNSINGKEYTGVDADVAEFEDLYLCPPYVTGINKMGLGIDEYCQSTINFSRKNYSDLLENGKIKLVGNTIKSKKMPIYIEKFLSVGIDLLLKGKGKEFLEYYYDYIEKIYNLRIPLKDIATVGKIKTSINTYKENCKQLTAGGTKKARQAWYELAIKHNLDVNMGDSIYYINIGNKKTSSDVQRLTKYFYIDKNGTKINYALDESGFPIKDKKGNIIDLTKILERDYNKYKKNATPNDYINFGQKGQKIKYTLFEYSKLKYPTLQEEDVLIFNCRLLSNEIVEDDEEHFCDEEFEYNKEKYIDMFNKRIRPLLVCFDKTIRTVIDDKGKEIDNILITNPKDRKSFTSEESKLISGQPYNPTDQDSYDQLMTIEDKEIKFWLSVNKTPPYAKECGIDWDNVVKDYNQRMEYYKTIGVEEEIQIYNKIINNISSVDINKLIEDGILPDKLLKIVDIDVSNGNLMSKKYDVKIGNINDFFEKQEMFNETDI